MTPDQNIKIAVDAIVFGYSDQTLNVLLIKQKFGVLKGRWALAGGFVQDGESLGKAVHRELEEEAGVVVNYLEQLYTFGDNLHRDPRCRVISVAYFALVNAAIRPQADSDAAEAQWFNVKKLPTLAFDHKEMIAMARQRLKSKLSYQPIGFDLLPKKFLFSELENLYCEILEREIDRRNFRKKILSFGIVEETSTFAPKSAGRPAKLFKFNKQKYKDLIKEGFNFEIKFA